MLLSALESHMLVAAPLFRMTGIGTVGSKCTKICLAQLIIIAVVVVVVINKTLQRAEANIIGVVRDLRHRRQH